jgi:ribosomal-protein-alanine N-acetyltransferase
MSGWLARLFGRGKPRFAGAGPRDAAALADLHAACFHRGWSEEEVLSLLADPAVLAHCVYCGRKPAGFVLSRTAADEAEILSIAVDERWRGRRLGRSLIDLHLRQLAGHRVRNVFLEVDEGNVAALRLYRTAGFRQVGRRPNYYPKPDGNPATALVLRRDLR